LPRDFLSAGPAGPLDEPIADRALLRPDRQYAIERNAGRKNVLGTLALYQKGVCDTLTRAAGEFVAY
jgi:hypothetical protein